jgi:hypothetical protein
MQVGDAFPSLLAHQITHWTYTRSAATFSGKLTCRQRGEHWPLRHGGLLTAGAAYASWTATPKFYRLPDCSCRLITGRCGLDTTRIKFQGFAGGRTAQPCVVAASLPVGLCLLERPADPDIQLTVG